jgi:hypothetical protein
MTKKTLFERFMNQAVKNLKVEQVIDRYSSVGVL